MKARRLLAIVLLLITVAALGCWLVITHFEHTQPVFKNFPQLISAVDTYAHDLQVNRKPLPEFVSLQNLVAGGYLKASDIKAFDGMDVALSTQADESHPQETLVRVKMADGSVMRVLADGSIQQFQ